jgi:hypothetical protein
MLMQDLTRPDSLQRYLTRTFRFREKLLPHIPVLMTQDFQDTDYLIETELPLVYCVCYVIARFLPSGTNI